MSRARVITVDGPPPAAVKAEVADALRRGAIVALPTDTIYGLSCGIDQPAALERLRALKGRDAGRGLIVLVPDAAQATALARDVAPAARQLMERYWPGPLTLLLDAANGVPEAVLSAERTVAVRHPSHPVLTPILASYGRPITSTSVNRGGEEPLLTAGAILDAFGDDIELVIDAGPPPTHLPSTIVDVASHPPRLVRVGELVLETLALDV